MSAKRSRQLSSARTAWDNVAARCDRAVLCARLLGSCLSARPPAATCLMAWPPSSALLAQPAPAVLLHTRVRAWRRFTAATQIYVAVRVWWRRLNRGGGDYQQSYETLILCLRHFAERAQGTGLVHGVDVRWAAGFLKTNILWSAVSLPTHRTLMDSLLYNGKYRTRRGRKRRLDGHLVQPSHQAMLALQPSMADSLRALNCVRLSCLLPLPGRKCGLIGPEIVI